MRRSPLFNSLALLCALAIVLACPTPAHAQFFQSVGGPPGAWVSTVARDSTSGAVYAGSIYQWGYNNYGGSLFKSLDNGQSWVRLDGAMGSQSELGVSVRTVRVSPSGAVYAALYGGGIRRSVDGGQTFNALNSGLSQPKARALAFAADGAVFTVLDNVGVYRLPPGSSTWVAFNTGLVATTAKALEVSGQWTLVGTTVGIYRQTGTGAWSAPAIGVGAVPVNAITATASGIFACTNTGLWKSTDDGATWAGVDGPFAGSVVSAATTSGQATLVASALGLYRSVTGGAWSLVGGAASGMTFREFTATGAGALVGGTMEGGIMVSADDGATWEARNPGMDGMSILRLAATANGSVLAGTPRTGIFRLHNGVWDAPDLIGRNIFALAEAPWGEVYAGNYNISEGVPDGHAYVSGDDGQTWQVIQLGANVSMVSGFVFDAATQGVSCSVAWNAGGVLQRSVDQQSWLAVGPASNFPGYFIGRGPTGDLYVGSEGQGVRRLPAGQSTWVNLGFNQSQQFAVAFNAAGDVFFGNDGNLRGVYRSTDGGQTFQPLNNYPSMFGHALAIAPDGTIFAASRDMGVWRSQDNGNSWQDVSGGLKSTSVHALVIAPDGYLYASNAGHGLYRSVAPVVVPLACVGDLDASDAVDGADLGALLASWGRPGSGDLNGSGTVDGADLGELLAHWGACPQ